MWPWYMVWQWASIAKQTTFKHIFYEGMDKHICPLVWQLSLSNHFGSDWQFLHFWEILLQSMPKPTTGKYFCHNLFVGGESHCSNVSEQCTRFILFYSDKNENSHHRETWHIFITAECHAECIPSHSILLVSMVLLGLLHAIFK